MRAEAKRLGILYKKTLAAVMAAASLCAVGCAERPEDDTFVMIDVGYIDSEQEFIEKYGTDGTYVAISGFVTPEPVVTPVPTPEPTPEPTRKPKKTPKPDKKEDKDDKKDEDEKEESKPTPTPKPSGKKTPYASKYQKVSLDYASSTDGVKFETTTLDGEAVSESMFARNRVTMVNIWTQT